MKVGLQNVVGTVSIGQTYWTMCVACATARQAAPSETIITETRVETVFQTDTVFLIYNITNIQYQYTMSPYNHEDFILTFF